MLYRIDQSSSSSRSNQYVPVRVYTLGSGIGPATWKMAWNPANLAVPLQNTHNPLTVSKWNVQRPAAGLTQTVGGLMLGPSVINLVRLPGLSPDIRTNLLGLLGTMGLYGGAMVGLGLRLARGRSNSREAALIGGGIATVCLFVAEFVVYAGPTDLALFAILDIGALTVYGLVFNWLRKPGTARLTG